MTLPTQKTRSTAGPLCIIHLPFLYARTEVSHASAHVSSSAYTRFCVRPMPGYPQQREAAVLRSLDGEGVFEALHAGRRPRPC
jgi:hypothetical protein